MQPYPPTSLFQRVVRAILLLAGIAVAARVIYELLWPLLPGVLAVVLLGAVLLLVVRGRR